MSDINALAKTIKDSWEEFDSSVFQKVHDRWIKALNLIADRGDNTLIDSAHGELLVPVVLLRPDADGDDDVEADNESVEE